MTNRQAFFLKARELLKILNRTEGGLLGPQLQELGFYTSHAEILRKHGLVTMTQEKYASRNPRAYHWRITAKKEINSEQDDHVEMPKVQNRNESQKTGGRPT